MTLLEIRKAVAQNLNILSQDGSTVIGGVVTATDIDSYINRLYREEIAPFISDKFTNDFTQRMYPQSTYTATGTVSGSSTTTTLVASTGIFDNTMEGFYVQIVNGTTVVQLAKISTYTSTTTVTIDATLTGTYTGYTIYVLGNEYTFAGDASNLKEVLTASIKYGSADTYFRECEYREKKDVIQYGNERFATTAPTYYLTTVEEDSVLKPAIGFLPLPNSYLGKWQIEYIAKPDNLGINDEPKLKVQGLSEVLVNGATAWGFRIMRDFDSADRYQLLFAGNPNDKHPGGKLGLIKNYKPRTRHGATKIRPSTYYEGLALRRW